ncbi:hypothetical protein J2T56_000258 [Natronobacillus azotifigens]|uniref:YndM family protein n=1 Tax=Natronobacillus azotifigens TaxID=472978 RepID=A0A9J6R9K8_9BACI|nr:YndM family protein [Natronobacillus azotifigens]MCZ0701964.1 YndM family protein [Natronobacillus azotifigens]
MKHVQLFVVKFLATLGLLYLVLGFGYGVTLGNVFMLTLVIGTVAYLVGDLFILPRTNNTVATVADFIVAFVVIFLMTDLIAIDANIFTASFISALALGVFELFFHKYVYEALDFSSEDFITSGGMEYHMETSEEFHPEYDEDFEDEDELF